MKRSLQVWTRTGMAAFAGLAIAATAGFAHDRLDDTPHSAMFAAAEQADPGIDFMTTGPSGPSGKLIVRSDISASREADRPIRRRMHLK